MWICAGILWITDLLHITKIGDFMNKYVTTIGNRIYGSSKWNMDMSVSGTLVHELTHVVEWDTDNFYSLNYVLSSSHRAYYESVCVQTEMLVYPNRMTEEYIDQRVEFFVGYGIPRHTVQAALTARLLEAKDQRPKPPASTVYEAYTIWQAGNKA